MSEHAPPYDTDEAKRYPQLYRTGVDLVFHHVRTLRDALQEEADALDPRSFFGGSDSAAEYRKQRRVELQAKVDVLKDILVHFNVEAP